MNISFIKFKKEVMKKKQIVSVSGVKTQKDRHLRPENKDNLDSRQNEEQDFKGDDITNNKKEVKSEKSFQTKSKKE
jgi:hypothetical protein